MQTRQLSGPLVKAHLLFSQGALTVEIHGVLGGGELLQSFSELLELEGFGGLFEPLLANRVDELLELAGEGLHASVAAGALSAVDSADSVAVFFSSISVYLLLLDDCQRNM